MRVCEATADAAQKLLREAAEGKPITLEL